MMDCTAPTTNGDGPVCISSGEEELRGIARYLGLAVAGEVLTLDAAAERSRIDRRRHTCARGRRRTMQRGFAGRASPKIAATAHPRAA